MAQNYQTLLASDPTLQAVLRALLAQQTTGQANLTAARQQALIGYGAVPNLPEGLVGGIAPDITESTRGLAQQNTEAGTSTLGQLLRGYRKNQNADASSLAARGILHSGGLLQHSNENLHNLEAGQAGAQQDVLGRLAGLWSGYQADQAGIADKQAGATGDALGRIIGGIGAGVYGADGAAGAPAAPVAPGYAPRKPQTPYSPVVTGSSRSLEPHPTGVGYQQPPTLAAALPRRRRPYQTARNAY